MDSEKEEPPSVWIKYIDDLMLKFHTPYRDDDIEYSIKNDRLYLHGFHVLNLGELSKWCDHHELAYKICASQAQPGSIALVQMELSQRSAVSLPTNLYDVMTFPPETGAQEKLSEIKTAYPTEWDMIERIITPFVYGKLPDCNVMSRPRYRRHGTEMVVYMDGATVTQAVVDNRLLKLGNGTNARVEATLGCISVIFRCAQYTIARKPASLRFKPY